MHLRVLTYNVAGLPWPVRRGRSSDLDAIARQLDRLVEAGVAPDLLLLQEAFTARAARIGVEAGYPNGVPGPRARERAPAATRSELDPDFLDGRRFLKGERFGKLLGSGLYVYSLYPIDDVETAPFGPHSCAGYDCLANKGAVLVTVRIPGAPTPVQVLNTHLNSRGASAVPRERSLYAHQRQVEELSAFLAEHRRPDWPLVYGGDFNTRHSTDRYEHKVAHLPGTVVRYYCVVEDDDCLLQEPSAGDAPWLETQDLQGFAAGDPMRIRPIEVRTVFDDREGVEELGAAGGTGDGRDAEGPDAALRRMLSDHVGVLVTYELSWTPAGERDARRPRLRRWSSLHPPRGPVR